MDETGGLDDECLEGNSITEDTGKVILKAREPDLWFASPDLHGRKLSSHHRCCIRYFSTPGIRKSKITTVPPDGEFPVMNYRMTQEFKPPFRINTLIEEAGALKVFKLIKARKSLLKDA